MHWNFDTSTRADSSAGNALDVGLFFVAVVLITGIAVLPEYFLTYEAAPHEDLLWSSLLLSSPIALVTFLMIRKSGRQPVIYDDAILATDQLTRAYRIVNSMVIIFVGGWAAYGGLNSWLDSGPSEIYYTQVLGKEADDGGRFERYKVVVSDWRGGNKPVELVVNNSFYERIQPGRNCLRLTVKAGAFGHEWIADRTYIEQVVAASATKNPEPLNLLARCEGIWASQQSQVRVTNRTKKIR